MSTPDPHPSPSATERLSTPSKHTLLIAGIYVDIYGLDQLPAAATRISCLWLYHGRLESKEIMAEFAQKAITGWTCASGNEDTAAVAAAEAGRTNQDRGLIAVAFDHRNHGSRLLDPARNEAWRKGNPTHAQDLFAQMSGAVADTGHLMDMLEGQVFGNGGGPGGWRGVEDGGDGGPGLAGKSRRRRRIDHHLALGVSLGGHAVWQLVFAEPRVRDAVVVIGCPDAMNLLTHRARKSKLPSCNAETNGAGFLGSPDFPESLVAACRKYDPAALLFTPPTSSPTPHPAADTIPAPSPRIPSTDAERSALAAVLEARVGGKNMLLLSGGEDKVVPYVHGQAFLEFFRDAARPGSFYRALDGLPMARPAFSVQDRVYEGVGHKFTPHMIQDAVRFVVESLVGRENGDTGSTGSRGTETGVQVMVKPKI